MTSAVLLLLALAVLKLGLPAKHHPPAPLPAVSGAGAGSPGPAARGQDTRAARPLARAIPISVAIASIGLAERPLIRLGRGQDGSLQVPTDYQQVGWYQLGPAPGQPGAAVLVGHVDSASGPAVFWRLGSLHPGNTIVIRRDDKTRLTFSVYAVDSYPKDQFPTAMVYGSTSHRAELRVITCGGTFDHTTGHYLSNTVVYATLTTSSEADGTSPPAS